MSLQKAMKPDAEVYAKRNNTAPATTKPIYTAQSAEAAEAELMRFEQGPWGQKQPTVSASWRRAWTQITPFFAFSPSLRIDLPQLS